MTPKPTLERYLSHIKEINREGSYYMRTVKNDNKTDIHNRLADLIYADHGEVALTRNTTESLDTVILASLGKREIRQFVPNRIMAR